MFEFRDNVCSLELRTCSWKLDRDTGWPGPIPKRGDCHMLNMPKYLCRNTFQYFISILKKYLENTLQVLSLLLRFSLLMFSWSVCIFLDLSLNLYLRRQGMKWFRPGSSTAPVDNLLKSDKGPAKSAKYDIIRTLCTYVQESKSKGL